MFSFSKGEKNAAKRTQFRFIQKFIAFIFLPLFQFTIFQLPVFEFAVFELPILELPVFEHAILELPPFPFFRRRAWRRPSVRRQPGALEAFLDQPDQLLPHELIAQL